MQITFDDLRVLYRLLHLQQETIYHLQQETLRLHQALRQPTRPTTTPPEWLEVAAPRGGMSSAIVVSES